MSLPDTGTTRGGVKTIAIRFKPDLHAQLAMIADLRDSSLQDEVISAVAAHIAAAKTDPQLLEKVERAQAAIEQEAKARQATIATLFEPAAAPAPAEEAGKPPVKTAGRRASAQQ